VNEIKKGQFKLYWRDRHTNKKLISHGDMEPLIIGTFEDTLVPSLKEAIIWEAVEDLRFKHSFFRWHTTKEETLPAFNLRITIVGDGAKAPCTRDFIFRLHSHVGPLELVPLEEVTA
jgi:hypothetical protein